MTKTISKYISLVCIFAIQFTACSKSDGGSNSIPPAPPPTTPSPVTPIPENCVVSGISQLNSGKKAELALTASYDNNNNVKKISTYDSTTNESIFHADFYYVTNDSVIIDQNQYIKLDANKRVILFSTKSDLSNPTIADVYKFQYTYNSQGYLVKKDWYINGSRLPNFSTSYTYTDNLLTKCLMTIVSSGNLKVLEADLSYENTINIKNWIYTFPDATIDYIYNTSMNFGNHCSNPLKKIVTKIYNPVSGILIDTWITTYGAYNVSLNGNVTYGEATGDLQEGIPFFYGKTRFYYNCQ